MIARGCSFTGKKILSLAKVFSKLAQKLKNLNFSEKKDILFEKFILKQEQQLNRYHTERY